jgi:hypothetical protein
MGVRKTLVISNSYDVTTDLILERFTPRAVFRLNFDQWPLYGFDLSNRTLTITSPSGQVSEPDIVKVLWRKPFLDGSESGNGESGDGRDAFLRAEARTILRDLYNLLSRSGKRLFNEPAADHRVGKLVQLRVAEKYFTVPAYRLVQSAEPLPCPSPTIVKSLASRPFSSGDVMYTTEVTGRTLAPGFPWFTQDRVDADYDVTAVYVLGQVFAYRLDRRRFQGLDWRAAAFETAEAWQRFTPDAALATAIGGFMAELGLDFGRLDFLLGDELVFLEVNPNGQWAWLDPNRDDGLFDAICAAIDPETGHGLRR